MSAQPGEMKLLANFRELIDLVSADVNYCPANPGITKTGLEAHYLAVRSAFEDVAAKSARNQVAINEREQAFEELKGLVKRAHGELQGLGAAKDMIADADTLRRKLTATGKTRKVKDSSNPSARDAAKQNSASQIKFSNQIEIFNSYISILANADCYAPNQPDLTVESLSRVAAELQAKNDAVSSTFESLNQARLLRDQLLHQDEDCLVFRGLLTKAYVAAAFGTQSQFYKQIKGLTFRQRRS